MTTSLTADECLRELGELRTGARPDVPMGRIFALAKNYAGMSTVEIESLLSNPLHEARVAAVSIMDHEARSQKTTDERREDLYELYLRCHHLIDTWDLVDRAAPYVIGGYLWDKSRQPLYELARSSQPMERRTAIVATYYFIRHGDLHDTFGLAAILAEDGDSLVQKAVGGWIREAGKRDPARLTAFLDEHAARMPRIMLSYAVEKLSQEQKAHYRSRT